MFTQRPDTDHLLAVGYDAQQKLVAGHRRWRILSFDHVPKDAKSTYSSVTLSGAEPRLAAPGSPDWLPQLLPVIYDYQNIDKTGNPVPSKTSSAGLIGSLPLLLALAAFSAPPESLGAALSCVQS